jgi:glutamyl-tRNA reductase
MKDFKYLYKHTIYIIIMTVDLKQDNYVYNRKEMIQKNREYRLKNVEKLSSIIECECGSNYQHQSKARHSRTNRHVKHLIKEANKKLISSVIKR